MIGNNPYWLDILLLSCFAWLFIAIAYYTGTFLFNIPSPNSKRKVFYDTAAGTLFIINVYACYCTVFKTINVVSLLLLLFLVLKNKNRFKGVSFHIKELMPFLYIVPVVFISYSLYQYTENVFSDLKYYSKIAYNLGQTGQENFYHFYNGYDSKFNGMIPYHYTELWLASIFNSITKTLAVFSLKNFAYPFLISLFSFGIISLVSRNILFVFLLVFSISALPLGNFIGYFDTSGWTIFAEFWLRPNLITYYLFLVLIMSALMDENWELFYVFIGIGLTFSIILVPVIIVSVFILEIIKLLLKLTDFKTAMRYLIIPVAAIIIMGVLYTVFASHTNVSLKFKLMDLLMYNKKIWKAIVTSYAVLATELCIIPLILFLLNKFIFKNAALKIYAIFAAITALTGLLFFQALTQLDNAYQFAYIGYTAIGFSILLIVVFLADRIHFKFQNVIFILVTVIVFYFNSRSYDLALFSGSLKQSYLRYEGVSEKWAEEYENYKANKPGAKGAFVYGHADLIDYSPMLRHSLTRELGSFICFFTDKSDLISITCKDTLLFDYTKSKDASYAKARVWMNTFPHNLNDCNPENYLASGEFDYFICNASREIKDSTLKIIGDLNMQTKLVYKSSPAVN